MDLEEAQNGIYPIFCYFAERKLTSYLSLKKDLNEVIVNIRYFQAQTLNFFPLSATIYRFFAILESPTYQTLASSLNLS